MTTAVRSAFVSLALVCCAGGVAQAQAIVPGEEGELANIVAPEPGRRMCYARAYSREHLAKHPQQTVTDISFRLAYHIFQPDDAYPEGQRNYYFALTAKRRGSARALTARGECVPDGGGVRCGVECDGGGVSLTRRPGDKLLVTLGVGGYIRMTEGCEEAEDAVDLEAGEDDREFLLSRLPDSECPPWAAW